MCQGPTRFLPSSSYVTAASSEDKTKCQRGKWWSNPAQPSYNLTLTQSAFVAQMICLSVALSVVSTNYAFSPGFLSLLLLPFKNMNFTNQCAMLSGNTRNNPPECANYTVLIKTITIIEHNYSDVNVWDGVISVRGQNNEASVSWLIVCLY